MAFCGCNSGGFPFDKKEIGEREGYGIVGYNEFKEKDSLVCHADLAAVRLSH